MTDINQPIAVETPAPISELEAAKPKLKAENKRYAHLSPKQSRMLDGYIDMLEEENKRQAEAILDLADRLSAYEAREYEPALYDKSLARIWDNETDAVYDRPNPQPFHMEPE